MSKIHLRRATVMLLIRYSRCSTRNVAVLLLVVACLLDGYRFDHVVQAAPTLSTPKLEIANDNCIVPSSLSGPNFPEPGDTLTIASTFTNDTGSNAAFRAVVRVTGTQGGTGMNKPVDVLYGGPTYIRTSGLGGAGWDDSYGYVVSTPIITKGAPYTIRANYSLLRQQLANPLNIANGATGSIAIRVELFSSDFSIFYGTASVTQTIKNTAKNSCPRNAVADSSPVLLTTNKAIYALTDLIVLEYSTIGADDVNKLPGWGDTNIGNVDIVRLDVPATGNPETDYTNNSTSIARTFSTWTRFNSPLCTIPCTARDERLNITFNYSYQVGSGVQAFTNWTTIPAASLTPNKTYLVRARYGEGNGSSSHPIQQPQWTYFSIGDPPPTAVDLVRFTAMPQADGTIVITWETATEFNTAGFHVLRSTTGARADAERITPSLIGAEGDGVLGAVYHWADSGAAHLAPYAYWLEEIEMDGTVHEYGPIQVTLPRETPPVASSHQVYLPLIP
jgi:hypothetical protein